MAVKLSLSGYVGNEIRNEIVKLGLTGHGNVQLTLSTKGGSYLEALDIFNTLRESKKRVECYIPSYALSAGAVIALAADYVSMAENALMMFHPPAIVTNEPRNSEDMQQAAELLKKCEDTLVATLAARCNMDHEKARDIVKNSTWFTAKEALEAGIIDEVIPLKSRIEVDNAFPVNIVNHITSFNTELDRMAIKDICNAFKVNIVNNNEEESLTAYIQSLQNNQPKVLNIPESIINGYKRIREDEINGLVEKGKITPAVATKLKLSFTNITNESFNEKGEVKDSYDSVITALKENEEVISFKGKASVQSLPKNEGDAGLLAKLREKSSSN